MPPGEGEVGPPFLVKSPGERLNGASHHGPLQERWLTTGGVCDDGA
jgi:hypothetical protein